MVRQHFETLDSNESTPMIIQVEPPSPPSKMKDFQQKREALHVRREERMARKLKRDLEKMRRLEGEVVIKVAGVVVPDKGGEHEIKKELEWWEEEMKQREQIKAQRKQKEEEIKMGEQEIEAIKLEFEQKVIIHLQQTSSASAVSVVEKPSPALRMREEAAKREIRRQLRGVSEGEVDMEQLARIKLLTDIDEKIELEKEIKKLRKETGLLRQKLCAQEKSHIRVMSEEIKKREEKYANGEDREIIPLDQLYAPKKLPPKPVILSSHHERLLAAQQEKEIRRTQQINKRGESSGAAKN